jgi:L-arabinose isomerase
LSEQIFSRRLEHLKALQNQREERENRERVAAWEARQAEQRAEKERAAEENEQIRREMAERVAAETAKRDAAERAHEPPVGMPQRVESAGAEMTEAGFGRSDESRILTCHSPTIVEVMNNDHTSASWSSFTAIFSFTARHR